MQKAGRIAGTGLLVSSFLSVIPSLRPFLDFIVNGRIEVSKLSANNTFMSLILHLIGLLLLVVGAIMLAKETGRKKIASYFVGSVVTNVAEIFWTLFFYSFIEYFVSPSFRNGLLVFQISAEPLIVYVILMILYCVFLYKACKELALATNMKIFSEAAKLFKWGGILLIVFGVGAIGILLGIILSMVGLFTIKQELPTQEM